MWGVRHRTVDRSQVRKIRVRALTKMIVREERLGIDMGGTTWGLVIKGVFSGRGGGVNYTSKKYLNRLATLKIAGQYVSPWMSRTAKYLRLHLWEKTTKNLPSFLMRFLSDIE